MNKLDIERLKECFTYVDGKLYWKWRPRHHFKSERSYHTWNTRFAYIEAGSHAETINSIIIRVNKITLKRSNIIWAIFNNIWSELDIDHKDNDSMNDKIDNLRQATTSQNLGNSRISITNTSGYKGVSWRTDKQKYSARIKVEGITKFLGYFDDPKEAHEAYCQAATKYFGEFANFG